MKHIARIILFCILGISVPVHAAIPPELEKLQQDLNAKRARDAELKKQLDTTESELADLRAKLVSAAREQENSEDILMNYHQKLETLQRAESQQQAELNQQKRHMEEVLTALLRMARTPSELMIIRPEKPVDNIRSAILLREALPQYALEAQRLSTQIDKLQITRADILDKEAALKDAQKTFASKQDELNKLLNQRQAWLKATESQRGDLQAQIADLTKEAQNVQDLVQKVTSSGIIPVPQKLKKGGHVAFMAPAKGKILYGFGDADDVGAASRGLTMRVRGGEMIVAPADGQVVFAGPFKGYGNILIIRHGDDYHSFLAGFGRLDSAVGQVVNAGEPLGRSSMEQGNNTQLYFELRYKGAPINPAQYVKVTNVATN
ncbi:MAG: peptidoglycan DD-metalloendopeptidase family protein [Alphaproteobacteria bacterium]|nr:peptidoglycan DD-metalloendopeptidase family protein [Alphaproteobacteria bacterium]